MLTCLFIYFKDFGGKKSYVLRFLYIPYGALLDWHTDTHLIARWRCGKWLFQESYGVSHFRTKILVHEEFIWLVCVIVKWSNACATACSSTSVWKITKDRTAILSSWSSQAASSSVERFHVSQLLQSLAFSRSKFAKELSLAFGIWLAHRLSIVLLTVIMTSLWNTTLSAPP